MPQVTALNTQLTLWDSIEEASTYHDADRVGYFSLLYGNVGADPKKQHSYRLSDMPKVIAALDTKRDVWISQAEFTQPNRRVVNLLRLGLLFADLDTYNKEWAEGRTPEQLTDSVLYHCDAEGLPRPSVIIFSGRGLQAKWLLTHCLPRAALPRWNACQANLVERLKELGSDQRAKDASRVLRLVDTVNTKSGEICRVTHVEPGEDGAPLRHSFEALCESFLPIARWDIEIGRKERSEAQQAHQLKLLKGGKPGHLKGFSSRSLAWHRLEDLRTLAQLRGGVKEGARMQNLFWQLNFLLLSGATNSVDMYKEAGALAKAINPVWNYRSSELGTLYRKAKDVEAGKPVEFAGREWPALYTPKNSTLINLFEITDDEQAKLRTIISRDMAKARDRERDTTRRRAAGAVSRDEYLSAAEGKREQAKALKAQGLSVRAIADQMGISKTAVGRYLQGQN